MEQMTYEQVLASIDPKRAVQAIAEAVIYLGGKLEWGSDEFAGVQEGLAYAIANSGLPSFGDQDDEALKFWGTLSNQLGYETDYEPASYVATISVPGYLPMDDDPPVFMDEADAWAYLAEERRRAEDDAVLDILKETSYSETYGALVAMAEGDGGVATIIGDTPGYDGDHDLGLAYSVSLVEED